MLNDLQNHEIYQILDIYKCQIHFHPGSSGNSTLISCNSWLFPHGRILPRLSLRGKVITAANLWLFISVIFNLIPILQETWKSHVLEFFSISTCHNFITPEFSAIEEIMSFDDFWLIAQARFFFSHYWVSRNQGNPQYCSD